MSIIVNQANFEEEVLKHDKIVLVDFWAPWCGPCRMMGPIIDEIATANIAKIKVCKVNVDENSDLAMQYSIMSIPTIIIFEKGKQKGESILGVVEKAVILKALDLKND